MSQQKGPNQWRTFFTALFFGVLDGAAFWWGSMHQGEVTDKMYGNLCWTSVLIVLAMAGRSGLQHASAAGGLKGALAGLLGPKDEPQAQPAPRPQ